MLTQLCSFLDGQFCHFRVVDEAATLRTEVQYLLSPGLTQGTSKLFQHGKWARAGIEREDYLD